MTLAFGSPQVVKLSKGNISIYIQAQKVDEILQDNTMKVEKPQLATGQDADKSPITYVIELNRFKHVFNIQGFLSNEIGSGNESYLNSKAVKNDLFQILKRSGNIKMEYRDYSDSDYGAENDDGGTNSTIYISTMLDKVQFTDGTNRHDTISGVACVRYNIQINLVKGIDKAAE